MYVRCRELQRDPSRVLGRRDQVPGGQHKYSRSESIATVLELLKFVGLLFWIWRRIHSEPHWIRVHQVVQDGADDLGVTSLLLTSMSLILRAIGHPSA